MSEIGEPLSERELDVLRSLSSGAANKQIAAELSISQNTVKVHLRNIYTKLGVSTRTEATTAAIQKGYITVSEPEADIVVVDTPVAGALQMNVANATVPEVSEQPAQTHSWRNTRSLLLLLLLGIALIVVAILAIQLLNQEQGVPGSEQFIETEIGDSRWLSSRPMPEGRAKMALAAVGLDLYQIGGETTAGIDGVMRVFDSLERSWRDAESKPTAVADSSAAELYGEIYVPGGRLGDGDPTAIVEAYSPTQGAWRSVAALPQALTGGLTLSDGAFLYHFGGESDSGVVAAAYVYDPSADSWRPLPDMPGARAFSAGGFLRGQLIVAGGHDGSQPRDDCFLFDAAEEVWSNCPQMLQARFGAGAAVLHNKLYVIGGSQEDEGAVSFSEVFDPNSQTWQVINTPMLEDGTQWPFLGVSHIETRIYAVGGRQGDSYLSDTMVYAPLVFQSFIPAASSGEEE